MALFQSDPHPATLLDLFLQRYANLLRFVESLTRDRRAAEDLVQDACVRLLLSPPDISHVENVEAYLITLLRNLHTAMTRRRQMRPEAHLSLVDFDSAGFALEALSHGPSSLDARDVLRTACRYACTRRFTSKTASLFILHFFHEYVRAEIGVIAHLSRVSVDTGLTRGRVEVRAYLDDPDAALAAIGLSAVPELRVDRLAERDDDDYLARLRAAIFALRHPRCFETAFLRRLYADADASTPISTEVLAEIVTCPHCLDAVSRIAGLPRLSDRHPRETYRATVGHHHKQRVHRSMAEQKARIIRAHRPRALRVLVNGFEVGSHDVTAPITRATHALSAPEPPRIVEIRSEQQICLATLPLDTVPDAAVAQRTAIELDEGRHLEVGVVFDAQWPTLQLTYAAPREHWSNEAAWDETPISERLSQKHARAGWRGWLRLVTVTAMLWLFFFTPGTSASAAEVTFHAIVDFARAAWAVLHPPAAALPARELPSALRGRIAVPLVRSELLRSTPIATTAIVKRWTVAERAQAEIRALASLQRVDAYLGQEIQFSSGRNGRARIEAIVHDAPRRAEIDGILGPLVSKGAIDLSVLTHQELMSRRTQRPPTTEPTPAVPRVLEFDRDRFEAADTLLAHLGTQQAVRDFAADIVDHSRQASLHAWSLQHLSEHFDATLVARLPSDDQDVLLDLVEQHAREFDHQVEMLSAALSPIYGHRERDVPPDTTEQDAADSSMWTLVHQLLDLNRKRDEAIHRALVVSTTSNAEAPNLASQAFWDVLHASRRIARALRHQRRLSPN